jgi:hypothetical protein
MKPKETSMSQAITKRIQLAVVPENLAAAFARIGLAIESKRFPYARKCISEIPRRIKAISIFISRIDDFDDLVVNLASFPPICIIFCDHLSQIRAFERFFLAGLNRNNGLRHARRTF